MVVQVMALSPGGLRRARLGPRAAEVVLSAGKPGPGPAAGGDPAREPPQIEQNSTFVSPRRPQHAAVRFSSVSGSRPSWGQVGVEPGPRPATLALGQLALYPLVPLGIRLSGVQAMTCRLVSGSLSCSVLLYIN